LFILKNTMTFARVSTAAIAMLVGPALQALECSAGVVSYDWRVTPVATAFDGVPTISYGINDRPSQEAVIDVQLGQDVEVRVTNELNESTCLHWHGLRQLGTQEMDGVPGVTQCDIGPNMTATYRFTPDKAGSFWWHSHHGTQYAFGLRGPLIVHAPEDELEPWEQDIDEEYTIQLDDVYHVMPTRRPIWDTVLINQLGRYNCTAAAGNNITDCNPNQPLEHFRFRDGTKYRLRLMNMAALAPFEFSIDDHEFQVIAADSEPLQPSELINVLRMNAGQRYDIIVQAKNASDYGSNPTGSFWMRAKGCT
jgi:iron transport multicopper oxidase